MGGRLWNVRSRVERFHFVRSHWSVAFNQERHSSRRVVAGSQEVGVADEMLECSGAPARVWPAIQVYDLKLRRTLHVVDEINTHRLCP